MIRHLIEYLEFETTFIRKSIEDIDKRIEDIGKKSKEIENKRYFNPFKIIYRNVCLDNYNTEHNSLMDLRHYLADRSIFMHAQIERLRYFQQNPDYIKE